MKVAIFHNYMDNIGGAERLVLTLARELNADIITTNINQEHIRNMGFFDICIKSIGKVPVNAPFRQQLALWRFRNLNLKKKYDFYIVSGDWAISGVINNKPNLLYVHSPIREIWDLHEYTRKNNVKPYSKPAFDLWVMLNRHLSRKYIKHANKIACNSINTQNRVKKYLNQDAIVINPPIETTKFHYNSSGNFWLSVNRLITHKRVDLQVKAFAQMPDEKLVIVGSYEKSKHFKDCVAHINRLKSNNVEIINWADQEKLIDLYANCKGFITTSKDEDFGMTPVEAMASGKPVIAPNEGGYKETIINGKTGILIDDISTDKIIDAVREIGKNPKKYKLACLKQAKNFDTNVFIKKIKEQIHYC
jgi:glycosyltransferase involved in cell wall biosynthesis